MSPPYVEAAFGLQCGVKAGHVDADPHKAPAFEVGFTRVKAFEPSTYFTTKAQLALKKPTKNRDGPGLLVCQTHVKAATGLVMKQLKSAM